MNIFKCNKLVVTILIFTMFMALASMPLPAASGRRGATVEVTMLDGSKVKGELLAVKADVLLIFDPNAIQGTSIDIRQVNRVKVLKKPKFLTGMAIGLGIGLGASFINCYILGSGSRGHYSDTLIMGFLMWGPKAGLIGGLVGAAASINKKFSLAGKSALMLKGNLFQLKRYAREQDFEKPAAN